MGCVFVMSKKVCGMKKNEIIVDINMLFVIVVVKGG